MSRNLISCENISKFYGEKIICKNQTFGIHEGDKIGFLGRNGAGKSTILKILAKKEIPDTGKIIYRKNYKVSYLPQQPALKNNLTIIEQMFYSDNEDFALFRNYYELLSKGERGEKLLKIISEIDRKNLWNIEYRAKEFLTKLGINNFNREISTLSGGEKRKVDIARILMEDSKILLLDEPTNHLDIKTIEWLQKFLSEFKGTIVFITHDRYFLDEVSNQIMEIEDGSIKFYTGNYSYFLKAKQLKELDRKRKEIRREAQLKKELEWLKRGVKARTSKPKNHIDRVKKLISQSYEKSEEKIKLSFSSKRLGKTILELEHIYKSFNNKLLIEDFTYHFKKNEKIGIIGDNGAGKTTLLRIILGKIKPDKGIVKIGKNTKFAYYQQENEILKKDYTVIDYIRETADNIKIDNGYVYSSAEMLKRFLFDTQKQYMKISSLSGGEKRRLFLLKSLMLGANFIIMDEPTNDFDVETLSILEDYLDSFKGNLLVVSHDRYFLDRTVDYLFIFENKRIIKFPGNYSDYFLVKKYQEEENSKIKVKEKNKKKKTGKKKLTYNEKCELEKIESELSKLEKEKELLTLKFEKEASSLSYKDFADIQMKIEKIQNEIEKLENRWLELNEKLE